MFLLPTLVVLVAAACVSGSAIEAANKPSHEQELPWPSSSRSDHLEQYCRCVDVIYNAPHALCLKRSVRVVDTPNSYASGPPRCVTQFIVEETVCKTCEKEDCLATAARCAEIIGSKDDPFEVSNGSSLWTHWLLYGAYKAGQVESGTTTPGETDDDDDD